MRQLALTLNGILVNGLPLNNGLTINGLEGTYFGTINTAVDPKAFGSEAVGAQWVPSTALGPKGLGDLSQHANILNINGDDCTGPQDFCYLDNRHINSLLQDILCDDSSNGQGAREYLDTLVGLAWPENTALWLCCSEEHTTFIPTDEERPACLEPDFVFQVSNTQDEAVGLAPHFLTVDFGRAQQEALTAAFIAKINTLGKPVMMDLAGNFDLGVAGTKTVTRQDPDKFPHYLGSAWGNLFVDCSKADHAEDSLCQASSEQDRFVGRDPKYHSLAMFTCNGESNYDLVESGKACFGETMEANIDNGCEMIAATGVCDAMCSGGLCGVNKPPVEGRGSTNVVSIYLADESAATNTANGDSTEDGTPSGILTVSCIAVAGFVLAFLFLWVVYWKKKEMPHEDASQDGKQDASTVIDGPELEQP